MGAGTWRAETGGAEIAMVTAFQIARTERRITRIEIDTAQQPPGANLRQALHYLILETI
jgi:hypothetical protein